jgi:hypothetical protein
VTITGRAVTVFDAKLNGVAEPNEHRPIPG